MTIAHDVEADAIKAEIAKLKAKYDRMPKHWEARRIEVMLDIEALVDRYITLGLEAE
jgi:hypothetical protein